MIQLKNQFRDLKKIKTVIMFVIASTVLLGLLLTWIVLLVFSIDRFSMIIVTIKWISMGICLIWIVVLIIYFAIYIKERKKENV